MSSTTAMVGPFPEAIERKYSLRRARITLEGSFEGARPEMRAVRAKPTAAGSPGLEWIIVPRVNLLKPRLPWTTSIALQTVGVSTPRSRSSRSSRMMVSAIFYQSHYPF